MSKKKNIQNQEALDAFYIAISKINDPADYEALNDVYDLFLDLNPNDVDADHDYMSAAVQILPDEFLDIIARVIAQDLIDNPIFYVIQHLPFYELMDDAQAGYLNSKVIEIAWQTDAAAIYTALDLLESENYDTALLYLNGLEHNLYAMSLKGLCFIHTDEPENALRHFVQLKNTLDDAIKGLEQPEYLTTDANYLLFELDINLNLLGLYTQLKYYKKAISIGKSIEEQFSLEVLADVVSNWNNKTDHSDYDFFCVNYAHAIDKLKGPRDAMKFLQDAMPYGNGSEVLAMANGEYMKRAAAHDDVDALLKPLKPIKRATSVTTFSKTSRFAREKHLEDMMIEHIKYGYEIFNRKLELYEDDHFIGRQYRLKTGRHILDLLLIEKSTDTLYIVELKRNHAGKEVYEQTRTYVDLLRKEKNKTVKGIICLHEFNQELKKLVQQDKDIELFTYNFNFKNEAQ
ncbi:hypothetical protein JCM19275_3179 [Nonlabens ulvanivorans]|uniref:Endonuclease NucS C-terminal domain-containing protein n=1 Tax=Nonlabens ulvanivorans TaxID=906888 RepID=A0A090WFY4_NONUL|nr:endonuclease NucS domain-containing protein [Nonlabens ulvanivorans]GAL74324.1 hypothetical protein JCM19275_3179 [Nonlabens ulvanivorans]